MRKLLDKIGISITKRMEDIYGETLHNQNRLHLNKFDRYFGPVFTVFTDLFYIASYHFLPNKEKYAKKLEVEKEF